MARELIETHIYNLLSNAVLLKDENDEEILVTIHPVKQRPRQEGDKEEIYLPSVDYKSNLVGQAIHLDDEQIAKFFDFTFYINAETHTDVVMIEQAMMRIFVKKEPVETDDGPLSFQGDLDSFSTGDDQLNIIEYYVRGAAMTGKY